MKKIIWILLAFAFIIRISLFFYVEKSLWLDEAALALNVLDKGYLELFSPLQYAQSAPPLFLCLTKVLVTIFGAGEGVFRFIPLVCSLASVFGFYFLLEEVFEEKIWFIYAGMVVFALSFPLLYNTIEFKPYMTDVLFTIFTALVWLKYLSKDISLKKQIGFALLLCVFPMFSFGSVFPVCAVLALSILKRRKIFSLILFLGLLFEYLFIFSKISGGTRVYEYWVPYFINYNPIKAFFILIEIIKYYFYPSSLVLLALAGFIAGLVILFKRERRIFSFLFLTALGGFLASFFNFYPLYERLSLFLYPIVLIIILSSLWHIPEGKNKVKKAAICFLGGIFVLSTVFYNFSDKNLYKREEIKPLLLKMREEIEPLDKIFVFKGAHLTWRYYERIFNFKNKTFVCPYNMTGNDCTDAIKPYCSNNTCYIIYSSEIDTENNIKFLLETVSKLNGKVIYEDKNSILCRIPGVN